MPHLVATLIYLSQIYSYYIRGDRSPLICFLNRLKSKLVGTKRVFKHEDLRMFDLKLWEHMGSFHPLEFVDRVSETQLQVGEMSQTKNPRQIC